MSGGFYKPATYDGRFSARVRWGRLLWTLVARTLFRWSPVPMFGLRRAVLRLFGAQIDATAIVYPCCRVWAPWNLQMGARACLGRAVDCYNVDRVVLEDDVTVSQDAFLCTASHDIDAPDRHLVTAPIALRRGSWVFARAMIGPGVTIGEGTCVGACAAVMRDAPPFSVLAGNPAQIIRERRFRGSP